MTSLLKLLHSIRRNIGCAPVALGQLGQVFTEKRLCRIANLLLYLVVLKSELRHLLCLLILLFLLLLLRLLPLCLLLLLNLLHLHLLVHLLHCG